MKRKKTVLKFFNIAQYRQEEEFLSSMHEEGWRLTKITFPGFYHFEECEPEHAMYRLDYNQEGIKYKTEYVQMFSDCGWEYLFDFVGYSYFYKKGENGQENEEIFCDDSSRLDMMKRVLKGRIVPMLLLFACVILPQLFMNTLGYGSGSIVQDILSVTFLVLAVLYLSIFGITAYQFYKYEARVSEDAGIKYKYYGIFGFMLLIMVCIGISFYISKRSVYSISERTDGFTITAKQLNRSIAMEYNLKMGDIIAVSHDYGGGEIFLRVGEENEDPVFYGNSYGSFGDFTLEIQEDGRYKIECCGRKAKGVISFVIK